MEKLLEAKLTCPKCFKEIVWSGEDFEDWIECECGHSDEAWFYWHTLNPITKVTRYFSAETLWVRSANYSNDALYMSREDFIDYSMGQGKGGCHGGGYTIRVWQAAYKNDNPNNGKCQVDFQFDVWEPEKIGSFNFTRELFKETADFCEHLSGKKVGKIMKETQKNGK